MRFKASVFILSFLLLAGTAGAQSTATIQGAIADAAGSLIQNAKITIHNNGTNADRVIVSDSAGAYSAPSLPVGTYQVTVEASGMAKEVAKDLVLEVGRITIQNFSLKLAIATEVIEIIADAPIIDSGTMTVGSVIDSRTTQEIPLNGRHFIDLASLIPGSVVAPANGNLTIPLRGQGANGLITAGGREDTTNFMINGINMNDMANGQLVFQPSIETVSEFKMDNQTYSAEYGRNSGSIVNIATKTGSNDWHGEGFEFLRNEDLDARNFFNRGGVDVNGNPQRMSPFKRNQFGGSLGGPIVKNRTFFFASYEGLRQRQGLQLASNVLVPSANERAAVTDPTIKKLLALIPIGTGGDGGAVTGDPVANASSFSGSAVAPVNLDQGTGDVSHQFSQNDRVNGYYVFQRDQRKEPTLQNGTIPGAGDTRQSHRQLFTLNETHIFGPNLVNEARLGVNRIHITFTPDVANAGLDPSTFGISNGLTGPIGIPQITVGGTKLVLGGITNFPQGRGDLTAVLSDTVNDLRGRHDLKFGGEYRRFNGNSFTGDDGSLAFANINDFLGCVAAGVAPNVIPCNSFGAARPNGFTLTSGSNRPERATEQAVGLFAKDNFKMTQYLTLEMGLRWEWNITPTEANNRSSTFLQAQDWLAQLGTNGVNNVYHQNMQLFEPRVGFAWDISHTGKTVLRSGYGVMYDQPVIGLLTAGGANPPFAIPLRFTPAGAKKFTSFATLLPDAGNSGLALTSTDANYNDAYVQTWNVNLQQQLAPSMSMMVGYFGTKGTHLNMQINENQINGGVRPFANLAANSPIIPTTAAGTPVTALGNITSNESVGTSSYNALWLTATKHLSHGVQLNANYAWSKSMDENSRNLQGITVQDSLNPFADRGLSDFDARHHFTLSGLYELPFKGNRLRDGWRLGSTLILQSGNPLNIVAGNPSKGTGNTSFTGIATVRPDLIGAVPTVGKTIITNPLDPNAGSVQWFSPTSGCDPTLAVAPGNANTPGLCTATSAFALPVAAAGSIFHFGSLRRNALTGPDFKNLDFSLSKTTKITERVSHELRLEAFDIFNHPNFGNPGLTLQGASTAFGVISATRNPTGDAGSSRQLQLAMKLIF